MFFKEEAELEDVKLVRLTLSEDTDYYEKLVVRYQEKILRYLLRLLNYNHQDAEDVTSETFMKAYINLASFNQQMKFSSWLYRIAHNEAVNLIKKKSKSFSVDLDNFQHLSEEIDFEKPRKDDLEKILAKLKIDDRNILTLFYLEERSLREISDILKITENNVAVKLKRARDKAKKITNQTHQADI
jgi:RNA polymerase sigma-70 factor (ECF subfamily)